METGTKNKNMHMKTLPCGRPLPSLAKNNEGSQVLLRALRQKLNGFVNRKNLKHSEAREKILETIVYETRHFKMQDLLDRVKNKFPEMGQATLYRNLPMLVECGILQEGPTDTDGQVFYELTDPDHHDHIVCLDCGKIFEFHDDSIEERQDSVTKDLSFRSKSHRHVIYASCEFVKKSRI
jgi:Fur family ferric uptake transcriptional regulator